MEPDELKRRICDAFGVTEEEVDRTDRALHGPEVREMRRQAQERVERDIEDISRRLSALLPDGLEFRFVRDDTPSHP